MLDRVGLLHVIRQALPLVLLAVVLFAALQLVARAALYHPAVYPEGEWHAQALVKAEDAWITTSDKVLIHGWWRRVPEARFTVLYLHGNAGNLSHRADICQSISSAGASVLVIDYRGYGKSKGFPTLAGLVKDGEAAYQWIERQGIPRERIILHGESIGTGIAMQLASRLPSAAVVLEAPFTSFNEMAHRTLPFVGPLFVRGFNNLELVSTLRVPILVIHGSRDDIVPTEMGLRVFHAARQPKKLWLVREADHNTVRSVAGQEFARRLADFYSSVP
jgi:fermentation-respiration switch protein FrsA (DUF1100 family)